MAVWLKNVVRKDNVRGYPPRRGDAPPRIVLHTTETPSLPGYSRGKSAPHFTVGVGHPESIPKLSPGAVRVWQHFPLDRTARSLVGAPKPEETNHMGSHCIQIEMITYIGDTTRGPGNRGQLPAPLVEAVADLVRDIAVEIPEIDLDAHPEPAKWRPTGAAYGVNASQRFSKKEWEAFNGICGHQHVPHNKHWDPGGFDIEGFVGLVKGTSPGSGDGPQTLGVAETGWPTLLRRGDRQHQVAIIRAVLQGLGYGALGKSELFNEKLDTALRNFQDSADITADGIWGPETHRHAQARIAVELARD